MNVISKSGLISIAVLMLLSACGQKGPLFLPPDPAATSDTQVEEESKDKKAKKTASE